jgi:hypothetical protein
LEDLQVEASLQLSIYSYATAMNGLADEADLRLRFDVLTKTKQPELHRYWTTRDRAANVRLYRLAAEVSPPSTRASSRRGWVALSGLPGPEPVLGVGVREAAAAQRRGPR